MLFLEQAIATADLQKLLTAHTYSEKTYAELEKAVKVFFSGHKDMSIELSSINWKDIIPEGLYQELMDVGLYKLPRRSDVTDLIQYYHLYVTDLKKMQDRFQELEKRLCSLSSPTMPHPCSHAIIVLIRIESEIINSCLFFVRDFFETFCTRSDLHDDFRSTFDKIREAGLRANIMKLGRTSEYTRKSLRVFLRKTGTQKM